MNKPRLPTSEKAKRIAAIFHRKLTTSWSPKEVRVFRDIHDSIEDEDLRKIERRYKAQWPPNRNRNSLRHDLYTFLNHYAGEVDRANIYEEEHPLRKERKIIPMPLLPSNEPFVPTADEFEAIKRFEAERKLRKKNG